MATAYALRFRILCERDLDKVLNDLQIQLY